MKLYEFFGNYKFNTDKNNQEDNQLRDEGLADQVFEYIVNNDNLQKQEFFPIAEKIFREATKEQTPGIWLPMVNRGCMEYYKQEGMKDNPNKIFTKEMRKELCNKMAEHYQPDILKGTYQLGK
jgi:hypothetical protein